MSGPCFHLASVTCDNCRPPGDRLPTYISRLTDSATTTEAPDLSSEHNASRKLAPQDESVKSARWILKDFWINCCLSSSMSDFEQDSVKKHARTHALAALESAIKDIIGWPEPGGTVPLLREELRVEQRRRLRSWIDGK